MQKPSSQRSAPRPKPMVSSIALFNYRNSIHGQFVPARVARNPVRPLGVQRAAIDGLIAEADGAKV
jgi:hypothetical protein